VGKFWWAILVIFLAGCSGLNATRNIIPVAESESTILPRSKGLASAKDNICIVVVPIQDAKEMDAFGVVIVNETSHWVSFKKEDFILIQSGEATKAATPSQVKTRMGGTYTPRIPEMLNMDIFDWRPSINERTSRNISKNISEAENDMKISIIGGTKEKFYLYFKTRDDIAPMQLIIPNVQNEATQKRTRFSFKFNIEES